MDKELNELTKLLEGVESLLTDKLNKLNKAYNLSENLSQSFIKMKEAEVDKANQEKAKKEEIEARAKIEASVAGSERDANIAGRKLELARRNTEIAKAKNQQAKAELRMMKNESAPFSLNLEKKVLKEATKQKLSQEELFAYSLSRETGAVINYLINGIKPESEETFAVCTKLQKSAIVKNIVYKLYKELDKINPNKDEIKKLRHELSVQISKCKRGK